MYALKPISSNSLDCALAKAERYRLLNEPTEAESICRDILEVAPANREARISLVLALTDELARDGKAFAAAMAPFWPAGPVPITTRSYSDTLIS